MLLCWKLCHLSKCDGFVKMLSVRVQFKAHIVCRYKEWTHLSWNVYLDVELPFSPRVVDPKCAQKWRCIQREKRCSSCKQHWIYYAVSAQEAHSLCWLNTLALEAMVTHCTCKMPSHISCLPLMLPLPAGLWQGIVVKHSSNKMASRFKK